MDKPDLSPSPELSRRERRTQQRRTEIVNAATQIFAQKGYAATTTKDIAEAVDLSESSLYSYFHSKREILMAVIKQHRMDVDDLLDKMNHAVDSTALVNMVEHMLDHFFETTTTTRAALGEAWVDSDVYAMIDERMARARQLLKVFLQNQIQAGVFRPLDPEIFAHLILGMYAGLILPFLYGNRPVPSPESRRAYAEALVSLLYNGVLAFPQPGVPVLKAAAEER